MARTVRVVVLSMTLTMLSAAIAAWADGTAPGGNDSGRWLTVETRTERVGRLVVARSLLTPPHDPQHPRSRFWLLPDGFAVLRGPRLCRTTRDGRAVWQHEDPSLQSLATLQTGPGWIAYTRGSGVVLLDDRGRVLNPPQADDPSGPELVCPTLWIAPDGRRCFAFSRLSPDGGFKGPVVFDTRTGKALISHETTFSTGPEPGSFMGGLDDGGYIVMGGGHATRYGADGRKVWSQRGGPDHQSPVGHGTTGPYVHLLDEGRHRIVDAAGKAIVHLEGDPRIALLGGDYALVSRMIDGRHGARWQFIRLSDGRRLWSVEKPQLLDSNDQFILRADGRQMALLRTLREQDGQTWRLRRSIEIFDAGTGRTLACEMVPSSLWDTEPDLSSAQLRFEATGILEILHGNRLLSLTIAAPLADPG